MIQAIENKIERFIKEKRLVEEGDCIVVGVSGGADSIALLHFLYAHHQGYQIHLKVAHIHHGIRQEADEDAKYVEGIATRWSLPFFIHYCNVAQLAKEKRITEEEAGRQERYNFFISLTNEGDKIAVAHNKNDQAETMLMRFIRGSGVDGLAAMKAKNGNIIRPLLSITREEIEYYCKYHSIEYKEDQTNQMPIYTRNKIRLECLPYIKEHINPNIIDTLFRHSELYAEEANFLQDYIDQLFNMCEKAKNQVEVPLSVLQKEKPYIQKRLLLHSVIYAAGVSKNIGLAHIEEILKLLKAPVGKKISLPYGLIARKSYHTIAIIQNIIEPKYEYDYRLKEGEQKIEEIESVVTVSFVDAKTFEQSKENMYTKYIDYDKIKGNLHVRTRKLGDSIVLSSGTKSLKKLFIDEKIPQQERGKIPLIVDDDEIIWVVGSRLNHHYYVTQQTTTIVQIQFRKS
jgi:tRNA(Ile)-lysidine synthase